MVAVAIICRSTIMQQQSLGIWVKIWYICIFAKSFFIHKAYYVNKKKFPNYLYDKEHHQTDRQTDSQISQMAIKLAAAIKMILCQHFFCAQILIIIKLQKAQRPTSQSSILLTSRDSSILKPTPPPPLSLNSLLPDTPHPLPVLDNVP